MMERSIDSRYYDLGVAHRFSRRKVDGVVPAKPHLFGKGAGPVDKFGSDFHRVQLLHEILECPDCVAERRLIEATHPPGLRQSRPTLGIEQPR